MAEKTDTKYDSLYASMYDSAELARIAQKEATNTIMEETFSTERREWNEKLNSIFDELDYNKIKEFRASKLIDIQAKMLSYRQQLNDEVRVIFSNISKSNSSRAKLEQEKTLFYAVSFTHKMSTVSQTKSLIDGHLREDLRENQIYQIHMEFLNESIKSLDNLGYSIKNTIEILNNIAK